MEAKEYKKHRQAIGSIGYVARILDISAQTIWNRETGKTPISEEAERALLSIPTRVVNPPKVK